MLINESGLVRCIKRAYRSAGYAVVTRTIAWQSTRSNGMSSASGRPARKVLATIVEHMGMIPDTAPCPS